MASERTGADPQMAKASECHGCLIRESSFCSATPDSGLDVLSRSRRRVRIPKRQTIVCEGEPATSFFNVTNGDVKLIRSSPDGRRPQIVGFRVAGEFFATPASDRYTITAEAVTDVEVCVFSHQRLSRILRQWPNLLARLFQMSNEQLTDSEEQVFLLGRKSARERVVSFLLAFGTRTACNRHRVLRQVNLPMTRTDIADFLGLTIETVSRVFAKLAKERLITVEVARSVQFLNLPALQQIAGDPPQRGTLADWMGLPRS